jgi:hypothetical protein
MGHAPRVWGDAVLRNCSAAPACYSTERSEARQRCGATTYDLEEGLGVDQQQLRARPRHLRPLQRLRMPVALLVGGLALVLAACWMVSQSRNDSHGWLVGNVVAWPGCPVERADEPCPPVPIPDRTVSIATLDGHVAATTTTDAQGRFRVELVSGTYLAQVAIVPGTVGVYQLSPGKVTVRSGQLTTVTSELDSGVR